MTEFRGEGTRDANACHGQVTGKYRVRSSGEAWAASRFRNDFVGTMCSGL